MRNPTFSKTDKGDWEARPFQGTCYRIVKRWLKGYVLYLNDKYLTSEATLQATKACAREHLHQDTLAAVNPYPNSSRPIKQTPYQPYEFTWCRDICGPEKSTQVWINYHSEDCGQETRWNGKPLYWTDEQWTAEDETNLEW